jgi:hypothetical protein
MAPIFLKNKYIMGENFSMLDVAIAPLLWRLDYYGIELSKNAPLLKYAERIFSRPAYIEALTPSEVCASNCTRAQSGHAEGISFICPLFCLCNLLDLIRQESR